MPSKGQADDRTLFTFPLFPLCWSTQDADGNTASQRKPSEYTNFVKENIARVKAQAPKGTPMKSIMKQIGSEWSATQSARQQKRAVLSPVNR